MTDNPWTRRSRRVVYDNPWITVWHDDVIRPDGQPGIYGQVHYKNRAVAVVARDDQDRVLLVGQYRYTLDLYSWELPEGGAAEGEDRLEAARRELQEETGYRAAHWQEILRAHLSNSVSDEEAFCYLATGLSAGSAEPEGTERLQVKWVSFAEALGMIDRGEITDALTILALHRVALMDMQKLRTRLEREGGYLRTEMKAERDLRLLAGESPAMRSVRQAVKQVAATDSNVLILGETGTGKELVARAIHQLSPRRERLLVSVNCAALAQSVIASELFGHEAGAFTGAVKRRVGRFELAQRGTIFLDEIGEIPPETQVLLLRVLQERVIERVGGGESFPVDVRVIAATNRDLQAAVTEGSFRADLFYRLNVFPINVPPLSERREDIPTLVRHFLHHLNVRMNKQVAGLDASSLGVLQEYDWPGNVRELENVVERAMIVTTGDTLSIDRSWFPAGGTAPRATSASLAETERRTILDALERCRGRIYGPSGAAAALGLKPTTLYGKIRRHGIQRPAT